MATQKKKATAKGSVKFKDLKAKKDTKGGISWGASYDKTPTSSLKNSSLNFLKSSQIQAVTGDGSVRL